MNQLKKTRLIILGLYVLLALTIDWVIKPNYLTSIIIVLGIPSLINFLWLKNSRSLILIFSLLSTLLFAPPIELVARLANIWDVSSIFIRPLGLIPLEDVLAAFLNFFWVLCFYKYFIADDRKVNPSQRFKYLILLYLIFSGVVYSLYFYNRQLLTTNYITIAIVTLIIPGILIFKDNLKLFRKTIMPTIFFALVFFLFEVVSLKLGSWFWPGEYLFPMNLWGQVFPLDDVIIWCFLSTPALIGGYEFFMDGKK